MKQQQGFTLIELVMVIVILGALAATALPKFINLQTEAALTAAQSIAGGLSSASTINFLVRSFNAASGIAVGDCNVAGSLLEGGLPIGYSIVPAATTLGVTRTCTLNAPNGITPQTFTVTGI